jgi:DNA-binding MarR family transcriptional regulator
MDSHVRLWGELVTLLRGMKDLSAQVVAESGYRLEFAGAQVLARLAEHDGVRLTALAAILGLDPSVVSRQVSALERQGWVRRTADPHDRRATLLALTDSGEELVQELRAARARALAQAAPGWTDAELDALTAQLARLNRDVADHSLGLDPHLENA